MKKIIKLQMFVMLLVILTFLEINLVSAWNTNTLFNNLTNTSYTSENITLDGTTDTINNVRYLVVPTNVSFLTFFGMNLSGIVQSNNLCYQESANVSNQSGIDGNCNLNYSGSYSAIPDGANPTLNKSVYDGNFSTYDYFSGFNSYFLINYSTPLGNLAGSNWTIKGSANGVPFYYNFTIPDDCINNPILQLKIRGFFDGQHREQYFCFNYTLNDWYSILTTGDLFNEGLYEEAMDWNITPIKNPSLSFQYDISNPLAYDLLWQYLGIYNFSNNTGNLLVNNPVSTFNINDNLTQYPDNNGYRYIPLLFDSDTAGVLQYSNVFAENIGAIVNSATPSFTDYITNSKKKH